MCTIYASLSFLLTTSHCLCGLTAHVFSRTTVQEPTAFEARIDLQDGDVAHQVPLSEGLEIISRSCVLNLIFGGFPHECGSGAENPHDHSVSVWPSSHAVAPHGSFYQSIDRLDPSTGEPISPAAPGV